MEYIDWNGSKKGSQIREVWFDYQQIGIYPNPGSDILTIETVEDAQMIVYDMKGMKIIEMSINRGKNQIDVKHWNSGTYALVISTSGKNYTTKWQKI